MLKGILIYVSKTEEARQKGLPQQAQTLADSM
jgi:hypothetical protein